MNKQLSSLIIGIAIGAAAVVLGTIATTSILARGTPLEASPIGSQAAAPLAVSAALGTGFTYQGQLKQGGTPISNMCDFQFVLYDAATIGTRVGVTQTTTAVTVTNGLFTVLLNGSNEFGSSAFNGSARWLQTNVKCPTTVGVYSSLTPRQALTAAPYALYALSAQSALNGGSKVLTYSVSTASSYPLSTTNMVLMTVTVTSATTETVLVDFGGDIYAHHSDPQDSARGYLALTVNGSGINFSSAEGGSGNGTDTESGLYVAGYLHVSIARLMPVVLKPGLNVIWLTGRRATGDPADVSYPWIKVTRP
jgi:hypothetical protein